jgi:CIC family chloride channel protein
MIGIFITFLFVRYVVKDDISHGVTKILYAISKKDSNIKTHNTFTSVIASTFTIGFGGSVGAEAPIVPGVNQHRRNAPGILKPCRQLPG